MVPGSGGRRRKESAPNLQVEREMKPQVVVLDLRGRMFHEVPGEHGAPEANKLRGSNQEGSLEGAAFTAKS